MAWTQLTVANATAGNAILASDIAAAFTNLNEAPRGLVACKNNTTLNQSITTSQADITGMSLTFTAVADRIYEVSFYLPSGARPAAGRLLIRLFAGATTIQSGTFDGADSMPKPWWMSRIMTFTAGSVTVKATAQIDAGSGTGTLLASSGVVQLCVHDLGTGGTIT